MILKLSNQAISSLSALNSSLILDVLSIDDRHILQSCNVIILYDEHCASNFDDVIDLQRMEVAHFSF